MIKIQKLLFVLLVTSLKCASAGDFPLSWYVEYDEGLLVRELLNAVGSSSRSDLNKVKEIVRTHALDLNAPYQMTSTIFMQAIDRALFYKTKLALDTLEYLIQNGGDINKRGAIFSPLERLINSISLRGLKISEEKVEFGLKLIALLLGYGPTITDEALKLAEESKVSGKIMPMLIHHQEIIERAETNPDENLLLEAIGYNKPYIVKLTVATNPELVTMYYLKLAEVNSPYSVPILKKALKIKKLREFANQKEVPVELTQFIEKFALQNL